MDRLSIRERPPGRPALLQTWTKLLFLHWPVALDALRARVPPDLEIDTCEGRAWIGLVAFRMEEVHPPGLPGIPTASRFLELNVRTYVHRDGVPGVYFFSLDAESRLAVWGARTIWHMPYFHARMDLRERAGRILYTSQRIHADAAPAMFHAIWRPGAALPASGPGSQAFFLTERYCLYTHRRGRLLRARVWHPPWPLQTAEVEELRVNMLGQVGLEEPQAPPLVHYSESIRVGGWFVRPVR